MGEEGPPKTEMINPALLDGVSANFIVKGPNGVEKAYPMRSMSVTIGRSDQCDIAVKDSSMSGKHAEISKVSGEIRVKDMGSANGIWLNGERVDDVKRVVSGYRDLAKMYDRIATSISQFAAQSSASAAALTGSAEQIADPDMKARVAEAQDLVDQRTQVTNTFIADWKKLGQTTNTYATQLDQAFLQGNKAVCGGIEKGVQAKTAPEVLVSCSKNFDKAKNAVEEKLKELDDVAGGGAGDAAPAE